MTKQIKLTDENLEIIDDCGEYYLTTSEILNNKEKAVKLGQQILKNQEIVERAKFELNNFHYRMAKNNAENILNKSTAELEVESLELYKKILYNLHSYEEIPDEEIS